MNTSRRSDWAGIGVGLAVAAVTACACLAACLVSGVAAWLIFRDGGGLARVTPAPTRDPRWTPAPAPTPGPEQLAQMDAIAAEVVALRGLQPVEDVERKFLSTGEVQQRVLEDFEQDTSPEEWQDTQHALVAFGLIDPNLDLYNLLLRLYSEGVAGFYDPDTGELVVVSEAGQLNPYEKTTFAHEYNHALQDQNYDLEALGYSDEGWEQDSERAAAVQALLEGDSTLLEEQYKATLSKAELREYDRVVRSLDVSIYYQLPDYLLQDFFFPYEHGLSFVQRYYDEGGWERVGQVWRDPPVSTEQIIHPERYEAGDLPLAVARPALTDTLGLGWREVDGGVMGEWYTYLILAYGEDESARLPESRAARAAEGWGGDSYSVFYNAGGGQSVLALHTLWDTEADAGQFADAFREYADARFGQPQSAGGRVCWTEASVQCLFTRGAHTLWVTAPDPAAVDALLKLYPDLE